MTEGREPDCTFSALSWQKAIFVRCGGVTRLLELENAHFEPEVDVTAAP